MDASANVQRIIVQCSCGKRLAASHEHAGKRTKCPSCGKPIIVRVAAPAQSNQRNAETGDNKPGMSKRTLVALWSSVGLFALGCVLFLLWYSHSARQAKIATANGRISLAVAEANDWLGAEKRSDDGATIEQGLADALKDLLATEKGNGEAVMSQVRQRREQVAEHARIAQAQRKATALFDEAKRLLDGTQIAEATALLQQYVADPNAVEPAQAQRLLSEVEMAVSDSLILNTLVAMNDASFERVKVDGVIADGKVNHPVLSVIRRDGIRRNLDTASTRRQENKIAEDSRLKAERAAAIERERADQATRQQAEQLRTRKPDVRKVCWGDSRAIVKQVEGLELEIDKDSLLGKVKLNDLDAQISYDFYDDKLVRVTYWVRFGDSGNPFEQDVLLGIALRDKYGEGQVQTGGMYANGINMSSAFRSTTWEFPRHTIELRASSFDHGGRDLFLTYTAKSRDAKAYDDDRKRRLDRSVQEQQEKLKRGL
jgi:predicted RNA-binding Zn-ribbon protein involved in translation (DUF1610 family)